MDIVWATLAAAAIGALGPLALRLLPEPVDPDPDKPLYATIARVPLLWLWLALAAGTMAAVVAAATDLVAILPAWVLVCGVGSWLAYVDLRTRLLPFKLTAPLHAATLLTVLLAAALTRDGAMALRALLAMSLVFAFLWVVQFIGRFYRGGALGYGDVRLGAILGLVLGPLGLVATEAGILGGFVIGGLGGLLSGKWVKFFAFGPYMIVGAVVGAVWPHVVG